MKMKKWQIDDILLLHRQLAIENITDVANRVDRLHHDEAELEAHGVELFELEQIGPGVKPYSVLFCPDLTATATKNTRS